jgi:hypothetical protein
MTIRIDHRLDDVPLVPVTCQACEAHVLVRKSSRNQTTVQWDAASSARCHERRQISAMSAHDRPGVFLACSALRGSIVDAVRNGEVCVVDEINCMTT